MVVKQILKKYFSKILFVWTGFFFVVLQMYIFVLVPQGKEKKRLDGELAKITARYQQAQDAVSEASRSILNQQIVDLKNSAGVFVINLENASNLTFDISRLSEQLKLSSLVIKTKSEQWVQSYNNISENQLLISFTSSFNQFFALLNALERHRPIVFIDTFSVTKPRQEQEGNDVTMELAFFATKPSETPKKDMPKNKS
jgi:Tfp pilus assembly protein PilO